VNRTQYAALYSRLAKTKTNTAECIRITRNDGEIFRFTAHDRQLRIVEEDGTIQLYEPADSFQITALETSAGLIVSNYDLRAIISDDTITEAELLGGLYNQANVYMFLSYWTNSTQGILPLRMSWMGELGVQGESFKADLRGIAQKLAQTFTLLTSLECRWHFCEVGGCGLNPATYTRSVTVTDVESQDIFSANIGGDNINDFEWGLATFTSGANNGLSMEISRNNADRMKLFLPMGGIIAVGNTLDIIEGCNKTYESCRNRYNNLRYFGGEPFLTGSDVLTAYPGPNEDETIADDIVSVETVITEGF